jgi:lactoylglutathione lyase
MATRRAKTKGRATRKPAKPAKARAQRHAAPRRKAAPKRAPKPAAAKSTAAAAPRAAAPVPNGIGLAAHHLDFTSHDLDAVKRFYTEQLGFTEFQHDPNFNYLMIKTTSGSSLGFMPPMPGPPEQWRPPREPSTYFYVEDVDRAHAALKARGVTFEQDPADMPWGHRVATMRDPEGRLVCLAQPIRR